MAAVEDETQVLSEEEVRLARQYEAALRANARRCARRYIRLATVVTAATYIPPQLDEIIDARTLLESSNARTRATRRGIARDAAQVVTATVDVSWDVVSPYVAELVTQQAGRQAERIVTGVQEQVASTILDSLTQGWTVPETAAAIQTNLGSAAGWQATMLARTDLISLSNGASLKAASALEDAAPRFKTWFSAHDLRVRPDHMIANGQTVPLDQPFIVSGESLMFPGDPLGSDENTINCRCATLYGDSERGLTAAADAILEEDEMPWEIKQIEDEFCVVKKDSGKTVGCHTSEEKAKAHMSVLYANESVVASSVAEALHTAAETVTETQWDTGGTFADQEQAFADRLAHLGRTGTEAGWYPEDAPLTAASESNLPPSAWFENPGLNEPTPLTVTEDGRVYGHLAPWTGCHTGKSGICRTPPRSPSGYAYFNLGEIDTADGRPVAVGKITADAPHAPLTANRASAAAHYDNTGYVAAYVRAGEDEHGIWLAGAVNPGCTEGQLRTLKANPPSGDWRPVNGILELTGALAVPVPGYPIARAGLLASADGEEELTALIMGFTASAEDDLDEVVFERKMKALTARSGGVGALAAAAGYVEPEIQRRLKRMKAAR